MFDILTTIITNFFRTFIIKKFISIFFKTDEVKHKNRGKYVYILFFIVTTAVHLIFHLPMINIVINILMIYTITQIYEGEQKKKILATIQTIHAARKMPSRGQSVRQENPGAVIHSYPHAAGKNFPAMTKAFGSISFGNMIPDSIVDGRKRRMEIMEVFAVSFTARPTTLAALRDTAIMTTSPLK